MSHRQVAVAVDCFVRASSLVEPVDRTIQTLREYDRTNVIEDLEVRAWPDEIPLTDATEDSDVVMRHRLFQAWADENDVRLEPAFAKRQRTSLVSDETETVLVLPVMCLAIHVDGELTDLAPHRMGATTYTVDDALFDLRGYATSSAPDVQTPIRCPACGDALVTGQGLYTCSACSWTDVATAGDVADSGSGVGGGNQSGSDESGEAAEPLAEDIDEQRPLPP